MAPICAFKCIKVHFKIGKYKPPTVHTFLQLSNIIKSHKHMHTNFRVAQNPKRATNSSEKLWYIQIMKYYCVIKNNISADACYNVDDLQKLNAEYKKSEHCS